MIDTEQAEKALTDFAEGPAKTQQNWPRKASNKQVNVSPKR